jgi:2'-5' RNA ligase
MAEIKLDIALELPPNIARQCVTASRELAKAGGAEFIIDGTHIHPHISVMLGHFPEEHLPRIKEIIENIASSLEQAACVPLKTYARRGYVGIDIKVNATLLMLHDTIAHELAPLQTEAAGMPGPYQPHITLIKFKSPRTKAPLFRLPPFTATHLALFEAGKFGVCVRRVYTTQLRSTR